MLDGLRQFIADVVSPEAARGRAFDDNDYRLAATALLIHVTAPVIDAPGVAVILEKQALKPIQKQAALRGIADKMVVYEIP